MTGLTMRPGWWHTAHLTRPPEPDRQAPCGCPTWHQQADRTGAPVAWCACCGACNPTPTKEPA